MYRGAREWEVGALERWRCYAYLLSQRAYLIIMLAHELYVCQFYSKRLSMKPYNIILLYLISTAALSAATDSLGFTLPLHFKGLPDPMTPCSPSLVTDLEIRAAALQLDDDEDTSEADKIISRRLRAGDVRSCPTREAEARYAADNNDRVTLEILAKNTSFDAPADDEFGWTCGMYAARSNALDALDFLFKKDERGRRRANPYVMSYRGKTALMVAAENEGCVTAVKKIIELCPEIIDYCCDNEQKTALVYAIKANQLGAMGALIKNGASLTIGYPLHYAVQKNNVLAVQMILKQSASARVIDLRDDKGMSPLMHAIDFKHAEIVDILCQNHANPFVKDNEGYTAWSYTQEDSDDDLLMVAYEKEYRKWKREQAKCVGCHQISKSCRCG
ncbi:ankyrin repeat domain-containing protein [Candidatus Dependentiae bacterium]|nr:ankyrin repeat domain-containing protein [Candidatus Dependentiae bacterium]